MTVALALALAVSAPQTDPDGVDVLQLVCADCHAGRGAEAGFDVAELLREKPLAAGLFDWRRARAMVEIDGMPPEEELGADERDALLAFFERVEREALEQGGAAGHEPARRLTRTELGNVLHDLLGVRLDLRETLPPELLAEGGFEASSATLQVHPDWLERAGTTARIALLRAFPVLEHETGTRDARDFDLRRFLRRAFRRPPTDEELARYEKQRAALIEAGATARAALRETLGSVLSSPHFILRLEDAANHAAGEAGADRAVGDHGLASRLSFFLWASCPDDELLDLADEGQLGDPEVLEAQLARLLTHARGRAFGEIFAGQWLGTHQLGTAINPDPIDHPAVATVVEAMGTEVALFVRALFVENRPLEDFLGWDVTFLNGDLAGYYGRFTVGEVEGDDFQRTKIYDSRRFGILGKAGVHLITSYPYRTSPVLRGAWILDELLGTPPPPPPPNASELELNLIERRFLEGPRGVLEIHREAESCANCHAQIDPLGFALEGFDRLSRPRRDYYDGTPVDTSGTLPDGTAFRGPSELSRVLFERRGTDLARQIARRLLSLALGRPLAWYDERTVVELADTLETEGFGALLRAVVASRPFRNVGAS